MIKYILIFLLAVTAISCVQKNKVDRSQMMNDEIERKVKRYEAILIENCKKDLIEEAHIYVDSLVLVEFRGLDTISSPKRPTRPRLNKKIVLNDSIKISPIISE